MDLNKIKSKIKEIFVKFVKELGGKFIWYFKWSLILLAAYVVLAFIYLSLPAGWQEGMAINAKNLFSYASSIAKEFSDFMGSVFTPERMTKADNWIHRTMAFTFIGVLVFSLSSVLSAAIFSVLLTAMKIKGEKRSVKVVAISSVVVLSLCATYIVVASQPVVEVADKITRFLAH